MTWVQEVCYTLLHSEPVSAMSLWQYRHPGETRYLKYVYFVSKYYWWKIEPYTKILCKIFGRNSITHIMASRKATHNKRGVMSLLPDHQHHCRRVRDKYSRLDLANESFLFRQSFWLSNYSLTSNNIFVRKWFWPTVRFLFIFIEKNFINWKN